MTNKKSNKKPAPKRAPKSRAKSRAKKSTAAKKNKVQRPKVEDLQVIDGKTDIEKIKNLEDLLGVKQANPFGTTSLAVLEDRMDKMGLSDLQALAVTAGILPSGNKLALKSRIKKEFKGHAGAGAAYHIGFQKPLVDPNSKEAAEIIKILNEGM